MDEDRPDISEASLGWEQLAVAKMTVTWAGLPPAVSKTLVPGRRQPCRFLSCYGSTRGGAGPAGAEPQRGRGNLGVGRGLGAVGRGLWVGGASVG